MARPRDRRWHLTEAPPGPLESLQRYRDWRHDTLDLDQPFPDSAERAAVGNETRRRRVPMGAVLLAALGLGVVVGAGYQTLQPTGTGSTTPVTGPTQVASPAASPSAQASAPDQETSTQPPAADPPQGPAQGGPPARRGPANGPKGPAGPPEPPSG